MDAINQEDAQMVQEIYKWREYKESLERLERNEDFKKVFLEGYLRERAVDAVSLLAKEDVKQSGRRSDIIEILVAISQFEDYMHTVKAMGTSAEQDMEEAEQEEDEG